MILAPEINPERVWDLAKTKINKVVENDCTEANGAQHIRSFTLSAEYTPKSWTLLLLPVIATYYLNDEGERVPLYINGQSGEIFGAKYASRAQSLVLGWNWIFVSCLAPDCRDPIHNHWSLVSSPACAGRIADCGCVCLRYWIIHPRDLGNVQQQAGKREVSPTL